MRLLLLAALLPVFVSAAAGAGELSPGLKLMLEGMDSGKFIKVLVVMQEQADAKALDRSMALDQMPIGQRHTAVVSSLRQTAQLSQQALVADLDLRKSTGDVLGYALHWIVNSAVVTTTVAHVRDLARRPDVLRIEPDLEVELIEPVLFKPAKPTPAGQLGIVTPGVVAIGATRVWAELGIDGSGSIVANMDSGVDATHPALVNRWRGNFVPPSHAWQDFGNVGSPDFPVDLYGHGTHVMGTITGWTAVDQIGVAPGAHWIATNAVYNETQEGFDNAILAGFEWLADPDGDPSTSDDVPDVVNNSWGVSQEFGNYLECDSSWWDVIDNCEAAGVVVIFSAGNDGPGPGSVRIPGNRASSPTNTFTVGSTSTAEPWNISFFSSRGPSECEGESRLKPEVAAPGADILSSMPNAGYAYLSGTSMAAPHVAGVVALMRQANPDVDVTTIKEILMETALDRGEPGEDNAYGHGFVDAYAAVMMVLNDVGSISGVISDASTGVPVEGAHIDDLGGSTEATTGPDGAFDFTMRAGARSFEITKFGYETTTLETEVVAGGSVEQDVLLAAAPWSTLSGMVRGPDGSPLAGASIVVLDTPVATAVTDTTGAYAFTLPSGPNATYSLEATAPGLAYDLRHTGLQANVVVDFHLPLIQGDGFESGDFETLAWADAGAAAWSIDPGVAHLGAFSARSGSIDHGQSSDLLLDYYVNGGGPMSFSLKIESEIAYDRLEFSIDGVVAGTWSGQVPWTLFEAELQAGLHTLRWVYRKDGTVSTGQDRAWIDDLVLPGTGLQPFADLDLEATAYDFYTTNAETESFVVPIGNAGAFPLDYQVVLLDDSTDQAPDWATLDPMAGVIYPAARSQLELTVDGYRAGAGDSVARLDVFSNDPEHPAETILVTVHVSGVTAAGPAEALRPARLLGAVPNPFNPATEIRFELASAQTVNLTIYDVAGRRIRTLVDGPRPAGLHRANWDGRDRDGRAVSSGVYFARMDAGGVVQARSLTLVR